MSAHVLSFARRRDTAAPAPRKAASVAPIPIDVAIEYLEELGDIDPMAYYVLAATLGRLVRDKRAGNS